MRNKYSKLINIFNQWKIDVTDIQLEQFDIYYNLLIEWNEKINLTAITDFDDVIIKHFVDSVSIVKCLDLNEINSVIDIGTGAGFPGIPIKIMFPHLRITLLDSLNKRINFLNTVIEELSLNNVETIHGRAEDFGRDKIYREQYDICVSRAVANLATLSELCIPFVNVNGMFVSYKSEKAEEELAIAKNALHLLGSCLHDIISFEIQDNTRNLVMIKKNEHTSKLYPRKAGTPSKSPL